MLPAAKTSGARWRNSSATPAGSGRRTLRSGPLKVRATSTGISAIVDADGRVLASLPLDKAGFIASRLPPPKPATLFADYGNTIPLTLALLLAIAAIAPRFRQR